MFIDALLLFLLLALLFLLTRKLIDLLFRCFLRLTHRQKTSIMFLTVLLLPGTAIHELSHLFTAFLLHVPAGDLTVIPKIVPPSPGSGEAKREIHAGSVKVGRTDPFRLTLIGLAPIPVGVALLYVVSRLLFSSFFELTTHNSQLTTDWLWPQTAYRQPLATIAGTYLLFTISCSMFSSRKDLKALLISGPIIIFMVSLLYVAGIRIGVEEQTVMRMQTVVEKINRTLLLTLVIDAAIFVILLLMRRFRRIRITP